MNRISNVLERYNYEVVMMCHGTTVCTNNNYKSRTLASHSYL